MTKSRHSSHSADTDAAKREAVRTGRNVQDILNEWLAQAKNDRDTQRANEIRKALKYVGNRNRRKRGKQ